MESKTLVKRRIGVPLPLGTAAVRAAGSSDDHDAHPQLVGAGVATGPGSAPGGATKGARPCG